MTARPAEIHQDYDAYTPADHRVWSILAERQTAALAPVACREYLDCLAALRPELSPAAPPRFTALNDRLRAAHGWELTVVPGFLPVDEFFSLLARRRFPSSTWLRSENQLEYLEEPDMFHDIFGHIPLFLNADYATFAERLGRLGQAVADDEQRVTQLQRLYWFTVEFGVIRQSGEIKIYGAGICSSSGETRHVFDHPAVEVLPFALDAVLAQDFIISEKQMRYFAIDDFTQLWEVVDELGERWGVRA